MIDGKLAGEGAVAGLTLLNRLVAMIQEAKAKVSRIALPEIIAQLPIEAHALARQYLKEVQALEQQFSNEEKNKTISALESERRWWNLKRYLLLRGFRPRITAITNQLEILLDDVVAVAHCKEAEDLIARSFQNSEQRVQRMKTDTDFDKLPLGAVLKNLHNHAKQLSTELGQIMNPPKG